MDSVMNDLIDDVRLSGFWKGRTRTTWDGYPVVSKKLAQRYVRIYGGYIGTVIETDYMFRQGIVGKEEIVNCCGDRVAYVKQ